jgi:serine/threonine protein kinase
MVNAREHLRKPDRDAIDVGASLGPYVLVRPIGKGGMGLVFEAMHRDLEKRVAVKVLHARLDGPVTRERFLREGRAAARVRHPNAVEVFDAGVDGGVAWLAMEYLAGEDLAALLRREPPLSVERTADLMLPVLAAVGAAHAEGIVHRDLKPENVFLTELYPGMLRPKVLDFGVARLVDEDTSLTRASVIIGTPLYMSPEQAADSRNASMLSDQYALGVVLYECVTARLPFEQEGLFDLLEAIIRGPTPPPRAFRPDLPAAFEELVLRALHRVPAHRFSSVHALGLSLLPFASPTQRAVWEPVFTGDQPRRTLRSSSAPPPPSEAPRPPSALVAVSVDDAPPAPPVVARSPTPPPPDDLAGSRPRETSTLSRSVRTLDVRARSPARPARARWIAALGVALACCVAVLLVPRHPAPRVVAAANAALSRAPVVAPVVAPGVAAVVAPVVAPVVDPPVTAAVAGARSVSTAAAPTATNAPLRRAAAAGTSAPRGAAPHSPRAHGVLILR